MAERQAPALGEDNDRADARIVAAIVMAVRLRPPGPGIAVDLDARCLAREGDALADIIEQIAACCVCRGGKLRCRSDCRGDHAALAKNALHSMGFREGAVTVWLGFVVKKR
ncbi:hypothetical protein WR25_04195 [Diploscapter pachys]|uniref:Uncharacterized protein n=1 Tax=Diploscapter pachys TaxID=2018661 RepID=A0A2A2M3Z6_9BILA|nr:hypothetical protein WR25_04195 [Diploscapter pachys]